VNVGVGSKAAASVAGSWGAATGAGATPGAGRHAARRLSMSRQAIHWNRDIVRLPKRQQAQIVFEIFGHVGAAAAVALQGDWIRSVQELFVGACHGFA
jgi:hypothetical protein